MSTPSPEQVARLMAERVAAGYEVPPEYDYLHTYRYNPSQPRDARGRWTRAQAAEAAHAANEERRAHESHPEAPQPGQSGHSSFLASLKGHARLIAAHTAYATGKHEAARAHLAKAEQHLKSAGERHGLSPRARADMSALKTALHPPRSRSSEGGSR